MNFGSVCSGISSASVAWEPLGWKAAWFSEIDPFPCNVLKERYHQVENLGDMTKLHNNSVFKGTDIDIIIGGTPCQSFSLGGKRLGLDDQRGDLTLKFLRLVQIKRPRWVVWENVAGVLSKFEESTTDSDLEEKFQNGCSEFQDVQHPSFYYFQSELQKLGYGYAYRVLDAQFFGVPQQRRRLFVVAHASGQWQYPARVLFESKASNNNDPRGSSEERSVPILTTTTAGNSNARGVVVAQRTGHEPDRKRVDRRDGARACTPYEEERRQGFPGNHTKVPGATNAERYKAIGNSVAIPVLKWVGEGIQAVETALKGR